MSYREEAPHAPSCASFQRKPIARTVREFRYLGSPSTKNRPFCISHLQKTKDLLPHCRQLCHPCRHTSWTPPLAVGGANAPEWLGRQLRAQLQTLAAFATNAVGSLFSCVSSFGALRRSSDRHEMKSAPLHENRADSSSGVSADGDRGAGGALAGRRARTPHIFPVPRTTAPAEARPFWR